ncbi:unnamed protein product [Didymodactylos carnosus]|uniref:Bax inhibitor 1 n=1 Tax=Didymodactylos carnosus TaxID=1234261 RepID=A0A8S2D547_9BILA|nr:unnamed protein product [Didymodactylos carnosus]CAF3588765.1 unnamed protein product [Didymodactylos carnosus]
MTSLFENYFGSNTNSTATGHGKSSRFNLETICDFSHLSQNTQKHLKNVYTCLMVATLCATIGVWMSLNGWMNYPRLAVLGSMISSIWLFSTEFNYQNQIKCFSLFATTAFCTGIYLNPLIDLAINIDPQIVMTAFLLTTCVFVCFTLSALLTQKRTYLYLGGLLGSGTSVLLVLSLMNLFGRSELLFNVNLYLGLALACGYILYDTQLIVARAQNGESNYIKDALMLFIDMVDLFVRILIILIKNSQKKEKKSNNR